ncbi:tripartite tricarboxylate transporter permease [Halovenus marina]|uniref:tripartite tricarboxylate transporter permease n=1 Tax=Halovenus marina TaxID=3396621 RepID=UPI003F54FF1E
MGIAVAPETTLLTLAFVLGGVVLGTVSGLVPGLHANNFALLLAGFAPAIPAPPLQVGAAMLAAGVVHTFLDIVPALALGVPDPAMAPTALPGHRLVLQGRGREALRLSALGSALAVAFAVPLAIPITLGMKRLYPTIAANLSVVLGAVVVALVVTEGTHLARVGAACAVGASGLLGVVTLDMPIGGVLPAGSMLVPLFAGLFGAPILIEAMRGAGVPPQDDSIVTVSRGFLGSAAAVGTLSGAVVGYLPGISSAIAAAGALVVLPHRGPRAFVVATSGVNTANTVFALFALVALGSPRTGVLVALDDTGVPLVLPVLLTSVTLAAAAGFVLVLVLGDRYLAIVGRIDPVWLSVSVLVFLCVLVVAFTGLVGLCVFSIATAVGLIPARFGARRMTCMGVLLVPLAL